MQRQRHKEWQNARPGFSARIIWFHEEVGVNIRLHLEDCEGARSVFPKTLSAAEDVFQKFKVVAPIRGERTPFVNKMLTDHFPDLLDKN